MKIDLKKARWLALAVVLVAAVPILRWSCTPDEVKRETQVNFSPGTIDCESLMNDPKRQDLRAWLAVDAARAIVAMTHDVSVQLVDQLFTEGAKEVLVGNVDADAGNEVVRDYVIVPPADAQGRNAFLRAWGGALIEVQDAHKRCLVVYGP